MRQEFRQADRYLGWEEGRECGHRRWEGAGPAAGKAGRQGGRQTGNRQGWRDLGREGFK